MKDCPKVAIVVLNWNGWVDTIRCLESIFRSGYPNYTVVVCDNGSEDNSVSQIQGWAEGRVNAAVSENDPLGNWLVSAVPKPIRYVEWKQPPADGSTDAGAPLVLIRTGANLGFARGNNVGIRYALQGKADYIFVLNNDTVMSPSCINNLIEFAESRPEAALLGPKILDRDSLAYTQWAVAKRLDFIAILLILSPLRRLIHGTPLFKRFFYLGPSAAAVYAVPGSAMMFRSSALRTIGLLDEATFIYWEEFIAAERLRKHGLLTFSVPSAVLWHAQGASSRRLGAKKFIENVRSEKHFFEAYLSLRRWQRAVLKVIRFLAYVCRMVGDQDYRDSFPAFFRSLRQS